MSHTDNSEAVSITSLPSDVLFRILSATGLDAASILSLSLSSPLFHQCFQVEGQALPMVELAAKELCFQKTRYRHSSASHDWIFGSASNISWIRRLHHLQKLLKPQNMAYAAGVSSSVSISQEGQVQLITATSRKTLKLPTSVKIVEVAGVFAHFLLLGSAGEVYSFGRNDSGQCGIQGHQQIINPTLIAHLSPHRVTAIAASFDSSAVVTDDGQLLTFGHVDHIGQGGRRPLLPTVVAAMDGYTVELISMNLNHTIVAARDGSGMQHLFGFGKNHHMELGYSSEEASNIVRTPTLIPFFESNKHEVVQLATGRMFSMALTLAGQVILWGQIQRSREFEMILPFVVNPTCDILHVHISAGHSQAMATDDTGKTYSLINGAEEELCELRKLDIQSICVGIEELFIRTSQGKVVRLSISGRSGSRRLMYQ